MRRLIFSVLSLLFVTTNLVAQDELSEQSQLIFDNTYFNAIQAKQKGDYNGALDMFLYLQKMQPENPAILNEIAKLLLEAQDYTHAAEYAQRAVDVDSTNNRSYIETAATTYLYTDHQEKILPLYDKLLAANPDDVETRLDKYRLLTTIGRYDEALKEADKIKSNDPAVIYEVELRRSIIYGEQKKIKKALDLATKLDKKYPNKPQTLVVLAHLYNSKGETEKAINLCEQATQCPNGDSFLFALADFYLEKYDYDKYCQTIVKAIASQEIPEEQKVSGFLQMVRNIRKAENTLEAPDDSESIIINSFTSLLQQYPANAFMATYAEGYYASSGKAKLGNEILTRFVEENPGTEYIWNRLISYAQADTSYKDDKDKSLKLIELCSRAMKDVPTNPVYGIVKGEYQYQLKDYKEALNTFNQVFSFLDGIDASQKSNFKSYRHSALNGIANCYQSLDSLSKAFIVYDQILSEDPDNELALNNYAYFLAKKGLNLEKAERMSMRSLNRDPLNATFLDTYAYILLREAKYTEAMFVMERCMENYSKGKEEPSADIHDHYGDILFNVGKVDEAVEQWKQALSLESDNALIKRKIDEKKYIVE